jgi:hypothetical protein
VGSASTEMSLYSEPPPPCMALHADGTSRQPCRILVRISDDLFACHDPRRAFSDRRTIAIGIDGRAGQRNAPALINRGYGRAFFWDGRSKSLEEQVVKPIEDPNEMGFSVRGAAARVGLSVEDLSRALAS